MSKEREKRNKKVIYKKKKKNGEAVYEKPASSDLTKEKYSSAAAFPIFGFPPAITMGDTFVALGTHGII